MSIEDSKIGKFQLEIRYTQILNFGFIIKNIAGAFSKLSPKFEFLNEGKYNETFTLVFEENEFYIDCRWDRIILVTTSDLKKLKDENSTVIRTFFDLFKKLSSNDNFGNILNYVLYIVLIETSDKTLNEITKGFCDRFIKNGNEKIFSDLEDIAIILDKRIDNKLITISMGPFSEKDIELKKLFPFRNEEFLKIKKDFGQMVEFNLFESGSFMDEKKYKEFYKVIIEQYNELKL